MPTADVNSVPRGDPAAGVRARLIRAEQIRVQYRIMPGSFMGSVLVAALVAAMLYGAVPNRALLPWLIAVGVLSVARFGLWRWFRATDPDVLQVARWGRLAVIASGLSGLVWGIGGAVLHDPVNLSHQLFLLVAITALAFTATYMTAPLLPAFLAYVCPSFLLSALPFLLDADRIHVAIGAGTLLLLPVIVQFATRVSRTFLESVNVRLQNAELAAELRAQKDAADEANVAKSRFLAVASHDLRQPLHALGLFVQALQESPIAAHERHIVGNIRRSVDAMEELFEAVLDISRLDAGVVQPNLVTFSLQSVFDLLSFEYIPVAREKGLSMSVQATSIYVRSDPSLLEKVLRNLVSNAIRYTERGGLLVGCRREADQVRIEVWDTGRGIPKSRYGEIFREFSKPDAVDRDHGKGLGLGLAIVDRLGSLLRHAVQFRSTPGSGSVFMISVPRGRQADYIASVAGDQTVFDLTGLVVLVIDPDPGTCAATEVLLGKWNSDVVTAHSAEEMRDKLASVHRVPGLIILDCSPETMASGATHAIDVVDMLRSEFNTDIPALLVTSATVAERAPGDDGIGMPMLRKPLNPARLRTLIATLLRLDETQERPRRAS